MPGREAATCVATLCRQSEAALRALQLPRRFRISQLHDRLEQRRGRSIQIIARRLPAQAPRGVWVAGQSCDYIFYDSAITGVHQRLVIGHEYGHMMFDDGAIPASDSAVGACHAEPAVVASRVIDADQPGSHCELRAEVFATVVLSRMESWSDIPHTQPPDPLVLERMVATLESSQGRW